MSALDFPVSLRLSGRPVLLVGGGQVALARAEALLLVGARLTVVAVEASDAIRALARAGRITLEERAFRASDLDGQALALTAIDDPEASRVIALQARARGLWVNAADLPELCDFTLPAVGRKGPITVAVSTAGHAPALAASLRSRFLAELGREHVWLARMSGWLRRSLAPGPKRQGLLREFGEAGPEAFVRGRRAEHLATLRARLSAWGETT